MLTVDEVPDLIIILTRSTKANYSNFNIENLAYKTINICGNVNRVTLVTFQYCLFLKEAIQKPIK